MGQQNNSPKVVLQVPPPSSVISDVSWMCTGVGALNFQRRGGRGVARARTRHHFNPAQRFNSHASSLQPGSVIPLSAGGTFLKRRKCVPHGTSILPPVKPGCTVGGSPAREKLLHAYRAPARQRPRFPAPLPCVEAPPGSRHRSPSPERGRGAHRQARSVWRGLCPLPCPRPGCLFSREVSG